MIKEIAPTAQAATDDILGVGEFQAKYFKNYPVYLSEGKEFYSYLGNKNLLRQKLWTWNPLALYSGFKSLGTRLKEKNIEGNMVGEGIVQGGLLLISPSEGVVYTHNEATGYELPLHAITKAIFNLIGKISSDEPSPPTCSLKSAATGNCGCDSADK